MGYPAYQTPEQIEAQRQAIENAKRESHDEGLKGHEKEISDYKKLNAEFPLKTDFTAHDIDQLKGMIEHANPDGVDTIGKNWKRVHDKLVGSGGGGSPSGDSAYGQLKKAVDGVLEHWEGESATQFKTKAEKILQQIANSASHAHNVSQVMTQASDDLRTQRDAISKIEKPSWFSKAWDCVTDSGRDDKYTEQDVKSGNIPKDLIAKANEGYIGAEKEEQLKAVAIMENLGRSYVGYSKRIQAPRDDGDGKVPPSNPETPMPTPIPAASGSSATPSTSGKVRGATSQGSTAKVGDATGPRDAGISGGQQMPTSQTHVDSAPAGISGGGSASVSGGGAASGVGAGGSVGGVGAGGATAGAVGGGLVGGGAAAAARGAAGRAGIGAAGGAGGRGGVAGAGAMGGRGGAAGAGGRGGVGAGGRGALARAKGGVAGAPKGISGGRPATPGGTGLGKGKGRGGAAGAGGRGAGMLAGRGANQRPDEEENEQGNRPDYLVEDEETWTPEDGRSVPKTIE
ncbi:hypothetical protein K378_03679 [Streptomyces sp. Amel2xB2]|uniref:WXG100 family type VII secretion target n=1 Tax=Streptomyces sp. Amel2xB2 TaxID=1305829 RepID=UPI000DB99772|nr:hypothetical protein [Streptomyces sp. Amel2xB2]RAJ63564.1 hypothetical protein K378_03679 [Streptomyces sp. Amel2xB2]